LKECAQDALRRLQRGEAFWAVTSYCGTNIAVSGFMAAAASLAANSMSKKGGLGNAATAAMFALVLAQPVGRLIQQHITTSPDLDGTEIVSIETRPGGRMHKVRTRRQAA
jgi:hypothetical protein